MRKKKILITLLVLALALSIGTVQAKDTPSSWAVETVNEMIEAGIVPERLQNNYQDPITRDEFAELLVNTVMLALNTDTNYPITKQDILDNVELKQNFVDADEDYIKIAYMLGSINGVSDTLFAPDNKITRQEAAVMLTNTIQYQCKFSIQSLDELFYDHDQIAPWAYDGVGLVVGNYLMTGSNNSFNPLGLFTREQAIITMDNFLQRFNDYFITLRGVLEIPNYYIEMGYVVDKDFVAVKYSDRTDLHLPVLDAWEIYDETKDIKDFSLNQAYVAYGHFSLITNGINIPYAIKEESVIIDCDYMYIHLYTDEYLMKFDLSRKNGYTNIIFGHYYRGMGQDTIYITPTIHQCTAECTHQ
ncbi:S-layer homology domain-containing protein [Vallitalea okinawensis]|uniref:S-layer homology domain-containing protein n=1 Tax=Vallitalea okinawensis TaxID=2078660 RepID=UPI001478E1C6|nr:S-layer homology domain-containing protein [Vallitalea okinawensis]